MSRRRVLKGVANALAGSFVSRNNDIGGYWGIGMLYREIETQSEPRVVLDLVGGAAHPGGAAARSGLSQYLAHLERLLRGCSMSLNDVSGASIALEFGTFGACAAPRSTSYGQPFVCTVALTSSSGRSYTATQAGRAVPHNPAREVRRNRAYAL